MIPFIKPYFDEWDFQAVKQVMKSGWVAQGPKVEELEKAVAKYLDVKHVVSTVNATTALTLALRALDIGKGDEVIIPDFTFPATAIAVTNVGAIPVLVDVDPLTYNIETEDIMQVITERTKAIMPVHQFGLFCDMNKIMDIAEDHDLKVIEDAACSLGTRNPFKIGQCAGTIGDIGCFSLHASKGITTGEGGLICTNDDDLADKMRRFSCFGDERAFRRSQAKEPFYFDPYAGNYKMSDITAALALSQLSKIEKLIEWRIGIAKEWNEIIETDPFLRMVIIAKPDIVFDHSHIYQSYVIVCQDGKRQLVMDYMKEKGFQCGIGTHAVHCYPSLGSKLNDRLKTSEYLHNNAISLPRYFGLEVKKEWYR